MRTTLLGTTIALIVTTNISLAQTYRAEVSLDYGSDDVKDFDIDSDTWAGTGTYYFSPVNTHSHPLAEAAFLERASNISLGYSRTDESYSPDFGDNTYRISIKEEAAIGEVEFYIPNTMFYIAAGMIRTESKERLTSDLSGELETFTEKDSNDFWRASLGVTPIAGLLVYSTFYEDVDLDEHWNLNAKYVMDWSGNAVNLEAVYGDFDGDYSVGLLGDFYFDRTFSVGVGYSFSEDDDEDGYTIRTRKFFTDNFSLHANYDTNDYVDSYNIGADLRF
jgi:hypothetical protein